jgi:hypothetical protein
MKKPQRVLTVGGNLVLARFGFFLELAFPHIQYSILFQQHIYIYIYIYIYDYDLAAIFSLKGISFSTYTYMLKNNDKMI